jgi:hypothetical protein
VSSSARATDADFEFHPPEGATKVELKAPAPPSPVKARGATQMKKLKLACLVSVLAITAAPDAHAQQYPLLDKVAERVVAKYQNSSCQQLAAERGQRPTGQKAAAEQRVLEMLHSDANMRSEFLGRVAAPIANKLFECGMIP